MINSCDLSVTTDTSRTHQKFVLRLLSDNFYFQCTEASCSISMVPEELDLPRYELS